MNQGYLMANLHYCTEKLNLEPDTSCKVNRVYLELNVETQQKYECVGGPSQSKLVDASRS